MRVVIKFESYTAHHKKTVIAEVTGPRYFDMEINLSLVY